MNNDQIQAFVERANSLIECKLILTDRTISNMLKFVATTPTFIESIKESLADISYAKEFARAKTSITKADGITLEKLKTPPTENRLFTFVVCLLTEFDANKRDLVEFLQEFYTNEDSNASYAEFAAQFLKPFKKIGEKILNNATSDDSYDKIAPQADVYFNPEHVYVNRAVMDELMDLIDVIGEKSESEMFSSQQDKADAKEITLAMKNALLTKNPKMIRVIWIGFYHTLIDFKSIYLYIKKMQAILSENNLI